MLVPGAGGTAGVCRAARGVRQASKFAAVVRIAHAHLRTRIHSLPSAQPPAKHAHVHIHKSRIHQMQLIGNSINSEAVRTRGLLYLERRPVQHQVLCAPRWRSHLKELMQRYYERVHGVKIQWLAVIQCFTARTGAKDSMAPTAAAYMGL